MRETYLSLNNNHLFNMNLKKYKKIFRDLKISHRVVAERTGYFRESITSMLNRETLPAGKVKHIRKEFNALILERRSMKNKKFSTFK